MHEAERGEFEKFDGSNLRIGIVTAKFNQDITSRLLAGAMAKLKDYQVSPGNITMLNVAGCVEIPLILQKLAESKKYDGLIALGAVIRGETAHFDYVCKVVSEGVLRVMLDFGLPVGFGVLTVDNLQQAQARLSSGAGAAEAMLQSISMIKKIKQ